MSNALIPSLSFLALLPLLASSSPQSTGSPHAIATPSNVTDDLPTVDLREKHSASSDTQSEITRAHRYDFQGGHPLVSSEGAVSEPIITVHISTDPVPTASSALIVLGTVTSVAAHLNASGSAVYSTFELTPNTYLKGSAPSTFGPLKLERGGGAVIYPDGHKKLLTAVGFGLPRMNHQYLLFLRPAPENSYYIITGYMIEGNHVVALDQQGTSLETLTPTQLIAKARGSN